MGAAKSALGMTGGMIAAYESVRHQFGWRWLRHQSVSNGVRIQLPLLLVAEAWGINRTEFFGRLDIRQPIIRSVIMSTRVAGRYLMVTASAWLLGGLQPAMAGHLNVLLEAELSGRHEVDGEGNAKRGLGDQNARGEAYVFGIDGDATTLCYTLQVSKIAELDLTPGNGRAAHIHRGVAGSNGPVVANLAWPQDGQAADCLTEGEGAGTAGAKFPGLDSGVDMPGIVQEILQYPENFYINVHNTEHPSGAIRGQLSGVHGGE